MVDALDVASSATIAAQKKETKTAFTDFAEDTQAFLKIFLTQLNNQDPLEPQDNTEFITQVAQLTNTEAGLGTNDRLDTLISLASADESGNLVYYVGKIVEVEGNVLEVQPEGDVAFSYTLEKTADKVYISIQNSDGDIVFTGDGVNSAGHNVITWGGTDNDGNRVPPGRYTVTVSTADGAFGVDEVPTNVTGFVEGVDIQDTVPKLVVNGQHVNIEDVRYIGAS